jgi:hypothetical protein
MPGPSQSQRAMSMMLVLLLHALLLLALLHLMVQPQTAAFRPERFLEMIIDTARLPAPTPVAPRATSHSAPRAAPTAPSFMPPSFAPPAETPDITALGRALSACALENLSNLAPQDRARCPNSFTKPDDTTALLSPQSHVKEPLRRAAEMRAKNTPGHIPCTYVAADKSFGYAVPSIDLVCFADGLFGKGFEPLTGLEK